MLQWIRIAIQIDKMCIAQYYKQIQKKPNTILLLEQEVLSINPEYQFLYTGKRNHRCFSNEMILLKIFDHDTQDTITTLKINFKRKIAHFCDHDTVLYTTFSKLLVGYINK